VLLLKVSTIRVMYTLPGIPKEIRLSVDECPINMEGYPMSPIDL